MQLHDTADSVPVPSAIAPAAVSLIEVGLRDGLQLEKRIVPTALKVDIIARLVAAGLTTVQVAAFVSPKRVPQMADADRLLPLLPRISGVTYNCLVLSAKGLDRAVRAGATSVEISVSASNAHSIANTGRSRDRAFSEGLGMIRTAKSHGLHVRAGIQCAFGCAYEGAVDPGLVLSLAEQFFSQEIDMLALADTTGMATPRSIGALVKTIRSAAGSVPLVLHLHEPPAFGPANIAAALEQGITLFDTALAGLGGCPFVPGAVGNISTGETARMLARMNIRTGIHIDEIDRLAQLMRAFLNSPCKTEC